MDKTFGFDTAVEEAQRAVNSAYIEVDWWCFSLFFPGWTFLQYINTGICTWYSTNTKVQMQERPKTDYYFVSERNFSASSSSLIVSARLFWNHYWLRAEKLCERS
jgi:hypothetical protein